MTGNLDFQIADITNAVIVLDYIAKQTVFKGWDNIRQLLALRDSVEGLTAIDSLVEQTVFQKWDNVRQIVALRDRLEMFVAAVEKETKLAKAKEERESGVNNPAPALDREAATAVAEAQIAAA